MGGGDARSRRRGRDRDRAPDRGFALRLRGLSEPTLDAYQKLRQDIGRAILLGLEILVAADIIRTVAVTPTLNSVIILGVIVLIRTFLSLSMQVEIEGRFPWQRKAQSEP